MTIRLCVYACVKLKNNEGSLTILYRYVFHRRGILKEKVYKIPLCVTIHINESNLIWLCMSWILLLSVSRNVFLKCLREFLLDRGIYHKNIQGSFKKKSNFLKWRKLKYSPFARTCPLQITPRYCVHSSHCS